ncbi:MAG: hypothetical protein U0457_15270 [Candidatus Sericytochromatia bacterium]
MKKTLFLIIFTLFINTNYIAYSETYNLDKKDSFFYNNNPSPPTKVINFEEQDNSPLISGLMSFFIPGAGQVYNENYFRGASIFTTFIALIAVEFLYIQPTIKTNETEKKQQNVFFELLTLGVRISIPAVWVYSWSNAYQEATPEFKKKNKIKEKKFETLN